MSTATKMKFSEFIDLLLAALSDRDQQPGGSERFHDLYEIARKLKEPVPDKWIFDAAKVLEARDLIQAVFSFGAAHAQLTGQGRLYVEEERGTGIIHRFHQERDHFIFRGEDEGDAVSEGSTVGRPIDVEKERRAVFTLLDRIEELLKKERFLNAKERQDLLADLESVRGQLRKREPNRTALAELLAPLNYISSVRGVAANLIQLINNS